MKNRKLQEMKLRDIKTEFKAEEIQGKKYLSGFIPYNVISNHYKEVILPTAFNKSINDGNVYAFLNHNDDKILGSSKNKTVAFTNGENGLQIFVELPNTTYAQDAFEIISRGDCDTLSFGFVPIIEEVQNGISYLKEVKLMEVSFLVPFPAYVETSSTAYDITKTRNIDINKLGELLSSKEITEDSKKEINEMIETIQKEIGIEKQTIEVETKVITENVIAETKIEEPIEPQPSIDTVKLQSLRRLVELETLI